MRTLQRALSATFKPAAAKPRGVRRRSRIEARSVATEGGSDIEHLSGGGFNVWPLKSGEQSGTTDPFAGHHYFADWAEVVVMVRSYAGR